MVVVSPCRDVVACHSWSLSYALIYSGFVSLVTDCSNKLLFISWILRPSIWEWVGCVLSVLVSCTAGALPELVIWLQASPHAENQVHVCHWAFPNPPTPTASPNRPVMRIKHFAGSHLFPKSILVAAQARIASQPKNSTNVTSSIKNRGEFSEQDLYTCFYMRGDRHQRGSCWKNKSGGTACMSELRFHWVWSFVSLCLVLRFCLPLWMFEGQNSMIVISLCGFNIIVLWVWIDQK